MLIRAALFIAIACSCSGWVTAAGQAAAVPQKPMKIQPPKQGILLGQAEVGRGDIAAFEAATGGKVTIATDLTVLVGQEEVGELSFDVEKARAHWRAGRMLTVGAYEAFPHRGFSVDRLLRGEFDADLKRLAAQFKDFGKPMLFMTAREPNGALMEFMGGGFGPDGTKSLEWAAANGAGFREFRPPPGPAGNPGLYDGLGKDDMPDALERLAAAQRYYMDFFGRREGIDFLTFDTMAWAVQMGVPWARELGSGGGALAKSLTFENFLRCLDGRYDWVSCTLYLWTEGEAETGLTPDRESARYLEGLRRMMDVAARLAPGKPVMISELGFPEPDRETKLQLTLRELERHPQVKSLIFWGSALRREGYRSPDCLIRPGTREATLLTRWLEEPSRRPAAAQPAP